MKPAPIDPPEVHALLWEGYSGEIGWDIGANCGQTIPEVADRFNKAYAFEPAEECWPYLADLQKQYDNLTFLTLAVSDENTQIELVALPDKIDTGQLVTGNCTGMEWDPSNPNAVARTLPARTVDSLAMEFGTPDFMKIDVEGHEEKVLRGASRVLHVQQPDLLIEFHSPQLYSFCMDLLRKLDYGTIEVVRHPHYAKDSWLWHQHGWIKAFA